MRQFPGSLRSEEAFSAEKEVSLKIKRSREHFPKIKVGNASRTQFRTILFHFRQSSNFNFAPGQIGKMHHLDEIKMTSAIVSNVQILLASPTAPTYRTEGTKPDESHAPHRSDASYHNVTHYSHTLIALDMFQQQRIHTKRADYGGSDGRAEQVEEKSAKS